MRLLLAFALALAASAQTIEVLDQAGIEKLEAASARNPADRQSQKLLGQNYALTILGITTLGKYDRVEAIDPARPKSDFAQHARDVLRKTELATVLGEGGYALWRYSSEVESFKIIRHMTEQIPLREERALAIDSIDRAASLDPDNPQWRSYRIPILAFRSTSRNSASMALADAYDQVQKDIATLKGNDRFYMLATAAKLAIAASAWRDARSFAQELVDDAPGYQTDWNYGNAVFYGNMVLGQVALHDGDKAAANAYLLASGRTGGSPQLGSFGPNMSLAKDLLATGERETVLSFFDLCRVFWKMDRGKLDQWKKAVEAGRLPDFGANLVY